MITKFHTGHVKAEVRKIVERDCYVHSDGGTMVINAGAGAQGKADAELVASKCAFECTIRQSERLGSFANKEAWAATGVLHDHWVAFMKPAKP